MVEISPRKSHVMLPFASRPVMAARRGGIATRGQ
jgi:hypothetical protein